MKKHRKVTGCTARTAAIILTAAMTFQNTSPAFALTSMDNLKQLAAESSETSTEESSQASTEESSQTSTVESSEESTVESLETLEEMTAKEEKELVSLLPNGGFEDIESTNDSKFTDFFPDGNIPNDWHNLHFWDANKSSGHSAVGKTTLEITEEGSEGTGNVLHLCATDRGARLGIIFESDKPSTGKPYLFKFKAKAESVTGTGFYTRISGLKSGSTTISEQKPYLTGTADWQDYALVIPSLTTPYDAFQIDMYAQTMTGDVWLDDLEIIETYALSFQKESMIMNVDEELELELTIDNEDAFTNEEIHWESSNEEVAVVDETGVVTALSPGTAVITAMTDDLHKVTCQISVEDAAMKEFYETMRDNWRDRLTGNHADTSDKDNQELMKDITAEAQKFWDDMNKATGDTDKRKTLWDDLNLTVKFVSGSSDSKLSEDFNTAFSRLSAMATAYSSKGSSLYKNTSLKKDMIEALEWMYTNVYNENYDIENEIYGNWWHWQIGMPQALCNIVILMYEDLPKDLIAKEAATLEHFNEDPNYVWKISGWGKMDMTSANLMDTALISALRGMISENSIPIGMAAEALGTVTGFVTEGDGFYEDGSCIQHTNLAYTGGYGATLLSGIEKILFLTSDSPWAVDEEEIDSVFQWMWEGYRPLFADGAMMDMVSGRGIARPSRSDQSAGKGILKAFAHLADIAPEEYRDSLRSFAKTELEAGMAYNENYFSSMTVADINAMKKLLNDDTLETEQEPYFKNFGAMDKAVAHTDTYDLGISMYSERTASFEFGNGENLRGWHMSDGALYLYNGDQSQYADEYWPTVDAHRLAGTTTDHTEGTISDSWSSHTSTKSWAGGSSLFDLYGTVGMDFEGENTSLTAKKSWFTFPDAIVALGTGISSDESKMTETIVENRKIRDDASNRLWIDGQETDLTTNTAEKKTMNWALLEGNHQESENIGYYFPETTEVSVLKETRIGNWRDINSSIKEGSEHDREIEKQYVSLAVEHGTAPENETYEYVILPGKTTEEMKAFSKQPEIEILSNTPSVQAVRHTVLNVTGYNFWEGTSVSGLPVSALTPASVMMKEEDGICTLGISNPTQSGEDTVIVLDGIYELQEADDEVTMQSIDGKTELTITGSQDFGKTYTVVLTSDDHDGDGDGDGDGDNNDSGNSDGNSDSDTGSDNSQHNDYDDDNASTPSSTGTLTGPTEAPSYAASGTWNQNPNSDQWTFTKTDGSLAKSEWICTLNGSTYEWFYFNEEGLMQTGWVTINGQTFYLQPASDGTRGVMLVGWHKIDGRWYHFQTESDGNRGMLLN